MLRTTQVLLVSAISTVLPAVDIAPVVRRAPPPAIAAIATLACDRSFDELTRAKDHARPGPIAGAWVYKAAGEGPIIHVARFKLSTEGRAAVADRPASASVYQRELVRLFVEMWLPGVEVKSTSAKTLDGFLGEMAHLRDEKTNEEGRLFATTTQAGEILLVGCIGTGADEVVASVRWAAEVRPVQIGTGSWCGTR